MKNQMCQIQKKYSIKLEEFEKIKKIYNIMQEDLNKLQKELYNNFRKEKVICKESLKIYRNQAVSFNIKDERKKRYGKLIKLNGKPVIRQIKNGKITNIIYPLINVNKDFFCKKGLQIEN